MRNLSCSITFSFTFYVISRKFGLLFQQCVLMLKIVACCHITKSLWQNLLDIEGLKCLLSLRVTESQICGRVVVCHDAKQLSRAQLWV